MSFRQYFKSDVDDSTLQNLLYTYGPLVVAIDATPLQFYKSGIMAKALCTELNHVVNLVGYVTSGVRTPYYILRNSWGTNWGEVS